MDWVELFNMESPRAKFRLGKRGRKKGSETFTKMQGVDREFAFLLMNIVSDPFYVAFVSDPFYAFYVCMYVTPFMLYLTDYYD